MTGNAKPDPSGYLQDSTQDVPDNLKFDYFCDAICDTYIGIQPEQTTRHRFDAEFTVRRFSEFDLATIHAPGHRAVRNSNLHRSQPDDSLFLNFQTHAGYSIRTNAQVDTVQPGAAHIIDNAEDFELQFPPDCKMRLASLKIPRSGIGLPPGPAEAGLCNQALQKSLGGQMINSQMLLLLAALQSGNMASMQIAGKAVISFARELVRQRHGIQHTQQASLALMQHFAESHLQDPALSVEMIANRFGCSIRTVQNRFSEQGMPFSRWILRRRLHAAYHALTSQQIPRITVSTIAFQHGFTDTTYFHRAFKREFGFTPMEIRDAKPESPV